MEILNYLLFPFFVCHLQIKGPAIRKQSSAARTVAAYPNSGCATSTMIVATTLMSRPTCAVNATVPRAGNAVLASPTTAAFQSGFSVMGRMTAATTAMSKSRTVQPAILKRISNVATTAAFQSEFKKTLKIGKH